MSTFDNQLRKFLNFQQLVGMGWCKLAVAQHCKKLFPVIGGTREIVVVYPGVWCPGREGSHFLFPLQSLNTT